MHLRSLRHAARALRLAKLNEEYFRDDATFHPKRDGKYVTRCREIVSVFITHWMIGDYIIN